jgi:hypothetical protein
MDGEKPVRRSAKLSNWMVAVLCVAVAALAYGLIAIKVKNGLQ